MSRFLPFSFIDFALSPAAPLASPFFAEELSSFNPFLLVGLSLAAPLQDSDFEISPLRLCLPFPSFC